LLLEWFN